MNNFTYKEVFWLKMLVTNRELDLSCLGELPEAILKLIEKGLVTQKDLQVSIVEDQRDLVIKVSGVVPQPQ